MVQVHTLLETLATPGSDRAPAALRASLEHLVRLISQHSKPSAWSMVSEEVDLLLSNLPAMAESPRLIVYWLKQFVSNGQSFATTVHRYRSPLLKQLDCVVILQLVACDAQTLRTQILEVIEDETLKEVVIASVFADRMVCNSLKRELAGFSHLIRFVSLCATDASDLRGLRNQLAETFDAPSPYHGLDFMPKHIAALVNK